mgnify:CR=1 FL=1
MSEGGSLRVQALLDRWFVAAIVGCLAVATIGGVLVHGAYIDPGTHQEQREVDEWRANGSFTHHSVVRNVSFDTPFEPGTTVRDRDIYFQRVMPVLTGEFVFATTGTENPVNLTVDRRLVVESVEETSFDSSEESTVFWQETQTLGINRTVHQPDSVTTVPFDVNVTRTFEEANNVSDRLDSPGETRSEILVTVVATRQSDDATPRRLTFSLPITSDSGIYRVAGTPRTEPFTETTTVTVQNEPSTLGQVGGPLLAAVGVLGALGLAGARYRGALSLTEQEREWLAYRDDRTDFDEWISTVRLPDDVENLPVAEAETLADLVDVAIDSDNPVLESAAGEEYYVVHDGYRYAFEAPPKPERDDLHSPDTSDSSSDDEPAVTANGGGDPLDEFEA